MGEELCNVVDEKCDLFVYSKKQQIDSLSQEDRDLLTLWTKYTFDALSDIHHEKKISVDIKQLKDIV